MVEESKIPLHELKYYYGEHLGFVFQGVIPSSDEAIQRLCENLVKWGVSKSLPDFYHRCGNNSVAFVFSENSGFQSGAFYQACRRLEVMGIFSIDSLGAWLEDN